MTNWRKTLLAIAVSAALLLLYFAIASGRQSHDTGEVGAILAGAAKALSLYAVAFLGVLCVLIALWHYKTVRLGIGAIAALMIAVPAGYGVLQKIESARNDKYWKEKRARDETVAANLVARYDAQLDRQGDDIVRLIDLRTRLEKELYAKDISWSAGGAQSFYWRNSLYIWVFADKYYPAHEKAYIDMGYSAPDQICAPFYRDFGSKFTGEQAGVFRGYCPRVAMN